MSSTDRFILWFDQISNDDVALVGGKNASLGEMYCQLASQGVAVPNGFAVTAEGYRHFLRSSGIDRAIADILQGLDTRDVANLRERGQRIRQTILGASLPVDLQESLLSAYSKL